MAQGNKIKTVEREPAPPYLQRIILFVQLQYTLKTVLIPKGEMDGSYGRGLILDPPAVTGAL